MTAQPKIIQIKLGDKNYPTLLREIPNAPEKIFVLGTLPPPNLPLVAVVGTRKHTREGKLVTEQLAAALARRGVGIVSGLALGIDKIAHEATLNEGGYTIGVLGSGLADKSIHPTTHLKLAHRIIEQGGCLITEYPSDFKATLYSFPARNRIIAGLTLATLVTEAPARSGALITAKAALDYNREVLCVPQSIFNERGAGNNKFIKLGARVATDWRDVFEAINLPINEECPMAVTKLSQPEQALYNLITGAPQHADQIIKASGLASGGAMGILTMLELKGLIKNVGGAQYALRG